MQIEVGLSKDIYGNTQVSGMLIEPIGNNKEAADAKDRLEEIYGEIVGRRASNISGTGESSKISATD